MSLEFVRAVECGDHAEIDQAPLPVVERGSCPDPSPAVVGDQLLEFGVERVESGEGTVHIFVTEHPSSGFESVLIERR